MFNGKAIYNPSGKAGEYAVWACNYYTGCSNDCAYCYCKKGILSSVMGHNAATLKRCFRNEEHAFDVFRKEVSENEQLIREQHGVFFSFTTDPLLPETSRLTLLSVAFLGEKQIPSHILTKCTGWATEENLSNLHKYKECLAIGFTLTGHDELEPHAASNSERIRLMEKLYGMGFRLFASIEPVIDVDSSVSMVEAAAPYCELFKIGLLSGKTKYERGKLLELIIETRRIAKSFGRKVYWKNSVKNQVDATTALLLMTPGLDSRDDYSVDASYSIV